jgi:hypothetical protein
VTLTSLGREPRSSSSVIEGRVGRSAFGGAGVTSKFDAASDYNI